MTAPSLPSFLSRGPDDGLPLSLLRCPRTGKRRIMTDAFRPKARAPRGFLDRRASAIRAERAILEAVARVYESYGLEALDTGAFEYADALGKFLPHGDRPNDGVFALPDDDEEQLGLTHGLTAAP